MPDRSPGKPLALAELLPEASRVLLTGTGKQFVERIGTDLARQAILAIMSGENVRTQTEPLTQQRTAQISGGMVALFVHGWLRAEDFSEQLSALAVHEISVARRNDKARIWPANWVIGLTGKSVQNVLRDRPDLIQSYVADFEKAIEQAARKCEEDIGSLRLTLGFTEDAEGRRVELGWKELLRITTAIGSQTLTIRGSDKSMFGKLFERLILGSLLTVLGFERVNPVTNTKTERVFWLSDGTAGRESDATLLLRPGVIARFDIGFIGRGNSEISKDKLSRYEREAAAAGGVHSSTTFIVVDKLPARGRKTEEAAARIGAEVVQMHMQYWPKQLAQILGTRLGLRHELQTMPDGQIRMYLAEKIDAMPVADFLSGITLTQLQDDTGE